MAARIDEARSAPLLELGRLQGSAPSTTLFGRLLREPFVHFLAIGLILFVLFDLVGNDSDVRRQDIVVDDAIVAEIVQQHLRVWQRAPTISELSALVDGWIRDEVLYRKGLQLGLDRNDPIVRRRVQQKVDVLAEESQPSQPPTDAQLQAWLDAHASKYELPPLLSFEQVFMDSRRYGYGTTALDDLKQKLDRGIDPAALSQMQLLPVRVANTPVITLRREFGDEFVNAIEDLPLNVWQGPVRSGYGLHFVRLTKRVPTRVPSLGQVRTQVARDVEHERRTKAAEAFYEQARKEFDVRIEAALP